MKNGVLESGYVGAPTLTNVLWCVTVSWKVATWVLPHNFHLKAAWSAEEREAVAWAVTVYRTAQYAL